MTAPDTTPAADFRRLLDTGDLIVAPGAYDAMTARLIEQAGFAMVYMTGFGTAASLGYPDYGLLTMHEMVDNAGRIADAVDVPLLADADTGFGNELNITRTVRAYEARGVAGLHLEDQVMPKRCGHLEGKQVVERTEFVSRIEAAVAARRSDDFVIVARTDAAAVHDFDEAIGRANDALSAGADVAFVEALTTPDQVKAVPELVDGPCLLNLVPGGKTPLLSTAEIAELGYRIAIHPVLLLGIVSTAVDAALGQLAETGMHPDAGISSVHDLAVRFGGEEWDALRSELDARAGG